jgi:multicomponent Na+:H+ antiporter subunit B
MNEIINIVLLTLMCATAIAVIRIGNLFAVVILLGVFSFLSALLFLTLDAPDVAFTEAAVGAGISTLLFLGTLALTARYEAQETKIHILPLLVTLATALLLFYASTDMPLFGDPQGPVHNHVAPYYLQQTPADIDIPNAVTAVLASYRGFDTLGEVIVILTAAIGVLVLIGAKRDVPRNLESRSGGKEGKRG